MLDAVIISDTGYETLSESRSLRLQLGKKPALIQNIFNYIENNGKIVDPIKGSNESNWHCAPKLNGIVLLDILNKNGFNVDIIDSYYKERDYFIELLSYKPKVVIISTTYIMNTKELIKLIDDIKSLDREIKIICGGPFVYASYLLKQKKDDTKYDTFNPKNDYLFLNDAESLGVDLFIVDRNGESILIDALNRIKNDEFLDHLHNTAHWNNDKYVFSKRVESFPLENIIDWQKMPEKIFTRGVLTVQASMGCLNQCQFCNFVKDKKSTKLKSIDAIINELKVLSKRGIKYIRFVDDNFRLGKNDLNEFCNKLIDTGIDIKWMSFIGASTLDKADITLLRNAGCVDVHLGIESFDATILNNMKKGSSPELYKRVLNLLLDNGINCTCFFIFGFPGETTQSIRRTIESIEGISNDMQEGVFSWSIFPFLLAPLSPIYEYRERQKYHLEGYMDTWEHASMNSKQAYSSIIEAFMKIDSSGPSYSEDNLNMLLNLPIDKRKQFVKIRHKLSKMNYNQKLDSNIILNAFKGILY